jgi:hypothetical protein
MVLMNVMQLPAREPAPDVEALATFVACAHAMLDPSTPEASRRAVEGRLLAQLPTMKALGVFELFDVRDPALGQLIADELEEDANAR